MRKITLNILILVMVLLLSLSFVACDKLDAAQYKGECTINLSFDKVYSNLYVSCPQGTVTKVNDKNYTVKLTDLHPVKVTISADSSSPVYLNYNTNDLKAGTINKDVTLGGQKYIIKIELKQETNEELKTNLKDCTIKKVSSKAYEFTTDNYVKDNVKVYINDTTLPYIIQKNDIVYKAGNYCVINNEIDFKSKEEYFCILDNYGHSIKIDGEYRPIEAGLNYYKLANVVEICFNSGDLVFTKDEILKNDNLIDISVVDYDLKVTNSRPRIEPKLKGKHYNYFSDYDYYALHILEPFKAGDAFRFLENEIDKIVVITQDMIDEKEIDLTKAILLSDINTYFTNAKFSLNIVDEYGKPYNFENFEASDYYGSTTYKKDYLFDYDTLNGINMMYFSDGEYRYELSDSMIKDAANKILISKFDGNIHDNEQFDLKFTVNRKYSVNLKIIDKDTKQELCNQVVTFDKCNITLGNYLTNPDYDMYKINGTMVSGIIEYDYNTYGQNVTIEVYKKYRVKFKVLPGDYSENALSSAEYIYFGPDNEYSLGNLSHRETKISKEYIGKQFNVTLNESPSDYEREYDYYDLVFNFTSKIETGEDFNEYYICEITFMPHKNIWYQPA